jgi:predicted nucleotidyltransferase
MKHEIEDLTGRKVDVVTTKGLSPYMAEQIMKEAVSL